MTSLSVVIGTRHRPDSLRRCLQSIVSQTRRPDEVVLVDDGNLEPAPFLALLEAAGIDVLYFNKSHDPGLTKSRNLGIRRSRGDVVMFLDDDVELDRGYMEAILRVYDTCADVSGVGGRLNDQPLSWAKHALLRLFLLDSSREGVVLPNGVGVLVRRITVVTPVEWFSGCNMSFRRRVFDRVMFDEAFAGNGWGDDRDFSYAVSRSHRLVCAPDATLLHHEEPKGRANDRRFGEIEITYVHRFFVKHMPQRPRNIAALWWGFLGITVKNVLTLRAGRVRGNLAGMREVLRRRRGTPARGLGVLSEQGGSIRNLSASGQGSRFVGEYLRRYADAFPAVYYFSYEDEDAALPPRCHLVRNRWRLHRWVYAFTLPLLQARRFRDCGVLRVMQLTGEVPAIIAKVLYGIPFIATYGYDYAVHARTDGAGAIRTALFALRTRMTLAFADRVIVTNPRIKALVERRIGVARVLFVPNAVDTQRFAPVNEPPVGPPVILVVGRLSPQKNLPLLLDAVARLKQDVIVRFVGDGPVAPVLAAKAAQTGLRVEFAGVVDHERLPDEFRRATVFAIPSRIEGHPKALIEAMSCGCACVGTNVEGIRDLLTDGATGLLVPEDPEPLAKALTTLLENPARRRELGANARRHVVQHYDIAVTLAAEVDALTALTGVHP